MIRKLIGLGNYSAVVSIPREVLKQLKWKRGQKVVVSAQGKKVQIKDFKPSK